MVILFAYTIIVTTNDIIYWNLLNDTDASWNGMT